MTDLTTSILYFTCEDEQELLINNATQHLCILRLYKQLLNSSYMVLYYIERFSNSFTFQLIKNNNSAFFQLFLWIMAQKTIKVKAIKIITHL